MARRGAQSFEKRRKERERLERQAAKRERLRARKETDDAPDDAPDEMALMERFRVLSERHAAGEVDAATYAAQRAEIFEALGVER